ncbi:MAG: hypothetical protein MJ239_03520 [Bacilli bacterium]|nr:hypothetical protein [Bacilli bacterium]
MVKKEILNGKWSLSFEGKTIESCVPGDITIDVFKAGLISNPYIAENYKDAEWVGRKNYSYTKTFQVSEEDICFDVIKLNFKGIDLFADIYVNGVLIGSTKNAFLGYSFNVKKYVKVGSNELRVDMKSTLNEMDTYDCKDYSSIFNVPRIFVRKPQCHFGWDWAPKICAYGIIDEVSIEYKNKFEILQNKVVADDRGNLRFETLLNYDNKDLKGPNEEILKKGEETKGDKLVYYVSKTPFGYDYEVDTVVMMGRKNYLAKKVKNPKLWWPSGYGEQPLYNYKIELVRDGKIQDTYEGRFAFRSVSVLEESVGNNLVGMDFYINGKKIFLKGANWVPPECFTGVMADGKYRDLIKLAKNMNANILRVWGGGAYEKDVFFDVCDEEGILVWQDFALACADIPEEEPIFIDNFLEEVKYQIIRLRNHPSLIYWCGGNEKTGCYGNCITHGDFLVNVTIYGLVQDLDGTRPYRRQSPHSYTDIGNNPSSGDSHHNCFEARLLKGMAGYREDLSKCVVPFVSECAVLGPSSAETLKKIFPEDKIWPMNEMWDDRFMENPYCGLEDMAFPKRERIYAEQLFGEVKGFEDFVRKAMIAQAQSLKAEAEYSRAHKEICGAFLNWMYNDIWPSGTWSTVDYYLEPKEAYYQLKRSYSPHLLSFYENERGETLFFADNQSMSDFTLDVTLSVKTLDGKVSKSETFALNVTPDKVFSKVMLEKKPAENVYLVAKYREDGVEKTSIYSPNMFAHQKFASNYETEIVRVDEKHIRIKIHANSFVKSLFIHFKDNFKYVYSDNYLDIDQGDETIVDVSCLDAIDVSKIVMEPFNG